MAKKDMQSISAALSPVAQNLPTQNVQPITKNKPAPTPKKTEDKIVQFSLGLRKSLRKELAELAENSDVTMRTFVLEALKDRGLSVTDADLLDMRKERG